MERTTPKKPAILSCDPSLTAWGWVVLQGNLVLAHGCIKTEPQAKKRKIREGDDRSRRVVEIIASLYKVIKTHDVAYIVSEMPHGSQNAKAAVMIGIVVGVMETISFYSKIPLEWHSEDDAKIALLGRRSATKKQIKDAVDQLYDVKWLGVQFRDEAIADALAIYYAAECHSPTLKYMNR